MEIDEKTRKKLKTTYILELIVLGSLILSAGINETSEVDISGLMIFLIILGISFISGILFSLQGEKLVNGIKLSTLSVGSLLILSAVHILFFVAPSIIEGLKTTALALLAILVATIIGSLIGGAINSIRRQTNK